MRETDAEVGNIVRVTDLQRPDGILASPEHIAARRADAIGKIVARGTYDVGGLVWVRHGKHLAPYRTYELTLQGVPDC